MSILEIKGLTHRYDDRELFVKSDLVVNNGEHIGVVGLNGAGKTTMMQSVVGMIPKRSGSVIFDGKDISKIGEALALVETLIKK